MLYLWLKAFHIIFMVAWFAGIFYIWRLFVYHEENPSIEVKKQLIIMAERLYLIIMSPAMILTVTFGILMILLNLKYFSNVLWIWIKLGFVVLVIYWHFLAAYYLRKLQDNKTYNSKKFRIMNEVPTVLLIIIVLLAVLKPF
ncbi:MAG: CopD family protein [Leptonema sp. (in: bacteria)]